METGEVQSDGEVPGDEISTIVILITERYLGESKVQVVKTTHLVENTLKQIK